MKFWLPLILCMNFACSPFRSNDAFQSGKGSTCAAVDDCRAGLVCNREGVCASQGTVGTRVTDQSCQSDTECAIGLVCDATGTCGLDIPTTIGDPCGRADGCESGLICAFNGRCAQEGSPGTHLDGAECEASEECAFGFVCDQNNLCSAFPKWNGVECEDKVEDAVPHINFAVTGVSAANQDFFQLPFPNVIREHSGHISYSGFPGLDSAGAPAETLVKYTSLLEDSRQGFSPNATVTTRFNVPVDFSTLQFGGDQANFRFVDLTVGEPGYGLSPRSRFFATGGRDKYICENYLSIRPSEGTPLREGHTYATIFFSGLKAASGAAFEVSPDLTPLLSTEPPQDAAYVSAWTRYQPLRQWFRDEDIDPDTVIGATVFTVGQPSLVVDPLKQAALNAPIPRLLDVTNCEQGGEQTPCSRSLICNHNLNAEALAITIETPLFLAGSFPYAGANSMFTLNGDGVPLPIDAIERCGGVYLPQSEENENHPLMVFLTDGRDGTAEFLDSKLAEELLSAGYAILVQETPLSPFRDGEDNVDPELLPHDLSEPIRARNLHLQGVMELYALERLIVEDEMTRSALNFANSPLVIGAHGLGVSLAIPFVSLSDFTRAMVLGGGEGGIIDTYLNMKTPLNTAAQLTLLLADNELNGIHPAMSLIQSWLDPRDPINFGATLRVKNETRQPKHIFYVYGTGNSKVSPRGQNALLTSMRLKLVGETLEPLSAIATLDEQENMLRANVAREATQGLKQYFPNEGMDGHSVLLNGDQAVEDVRNFVEQLNEDDGIPSLLP